TAAEAARLGISKDKLSKLVKMGLIPVIKLGHSTHLFDPETTDAALRSLLFNAQLRCYRVCVPRVPRTTELIGYRVARDEDENREPDASGNSHNLYKDIRYGWLHYCYGYEVKIGNCEVLVDIICERCSLGKSLEEIRARFRDRYGPGVEIPSLLEPPP